MAKRRWVFEPGDRFVTMAEDGRAYLWSVADSGDVKGRLADMNDRRSGCGYIVTDEFCEVESGSDDQRAELDRHMAVVEALDETEVQWALRHALIAAVLYRDEHRPEALARYARDLLGTMRLHASSRYRQAVAEVAKRPPGTGTIPLAHLLDVLRRDSEQSGGPQPGCYDCRLPYADPAWLDAVVPDEDWRAISPTGDEGGLLCITCMVRRLAAAGRSDVPVKVYSGSNTVVGGHDFTREGTDG